jgi:hypothetical protein
MKTLIVFLAALLLSSSALKANTHFLSTQLQRAEAGDWVMVEQQRTWTLLIVRDVNLPYLRFDEITAPATELAAYKNSWFDWLQAGAPGQISWVSYRLDTKSGQIDQAYSKTRQCALTIPPEENFFASLLKLEFKHLSETQRKRIGHRRSKEGEDNRPLWQPPMIVDGKERLDAQFEAWDAVWPKDGSEMAGKRIELYFPQGESAAPTYFPYWVQVYANVGALRFRVIDSGSY